MEKSKTKKELELQAAMIKSLHKQGWFATKTSDRFRAGRPDLRIGKREFGQLDVELKYSLDSFTAEQDTGLTKLQWLKIKEMNEHGIPSVCLVYSERLDLFFVTTLLRETLPPPHRCLKKLPRCEVINGDLLFTVSIGHLNELGY